MCLVGGNGFIGSRVAARLTQLGHELVLVLRPGASTERLGDTPFERVTGDVRDAAGLRTAMRRCQATIHLAAPGGWGDDDPLVLRAVIEGGTRNVLDIAAEIGRHRVVFVSSVAAVNGSAAPTIFDERSPFTLRDPALRYAHAKHRAEEIVREAALRGVDAVIVNPAEVYGPGDVQLVTAGNLLDFATASPVLVCDGGTSVVHVDDVAQGIVGALDRGRRGERYILAGENLTIHELAALVLALCGRRARIVRVPNGVARAAAGLARTTRIPVPFNPHVVPYATRYWFVSNAKARHELGTAFRGARETIGATMDWLRSSGRLPRSA